MGEVELTGRPDHDPIAGLLHAFGKGLQLTNLNPSDRSGLKGLTCQQGADHKGYLAQLIDLARDMQGPMALGSFTRSDVQSTSEIDHRAFVWIEIEQG